MNWGVLKKSDVPRADIDVFRHRFDKIFDDFLDLRGENLFETGWIPSVDVEDNKNTYVVKADIPGLDPKEIDVNLNGNCLTISGEKKEETTKKDKNTVISERRYGSFRRSISLPETIKNESIKADYTNGVLTIQIPKKEESAKKIQINVK